MTAQRVDRGTRIEHVRLALGVRMHGFVSLKRFGAMVATEEGRPDAYDTSTAKRWESGAAPSLGAIEAMARLAQRHGLAYVTRAWLAFGDEALDEVRQAPPAPHIERVVIAEQSEPEPATATGAPALPLRKPQRPLVLKNVKGKGRS